MGDLNITSILEIMKEECEIFENMLLLSQKKTNILINREILELDKITKIENEIAIKLEKLEEDRFFKVCDVLDELKVENYSKDILTLAKFVNEEDSNLLLSLREQMLKVIKELKKQNELNGKLINNSMEYVDFLINVVTNKDNVADNNYSDSGKLSQNGASNRLFDLKL